MLDIKNLQPGDELIVLGNDTAGVPAGTVGLFIEACPNPEWIAIMIHDEPTPIAFRVENLRRYRSCQ